MGMKITLDLNFECINEEILKEYQAHLKKIWVKNRRYYGAVPFV